MRGKALACAEQRRRLGITPAYAGKRDCKEAKKMVHRDHPRVCGETVCCLICQLYAVGSPPRMRGNASAPGLRRWYARITPAYAGKRAVRLDIQESEPGSPPRMRGNVSIFCGLCTVVGITPAYAGKRSGPLPPSSRTRDHPRVCGETPCPPAGRGHRRGSPPRMRGNAKQIQPTAGYQGITPAYAGKRKQEAIQKNKCGDHPRVCGEKFLLFFP